MIGKSIPGTGSETRPNQALHTAEQRQGLALWPPADFVYIKMILTEWAYVIAYQTSSVRNHWLPRHLGVYNGQRCHIALGGLTPQQSLQRLLITE